MTKESVACHFWDTTANTSKGGHNGSCKQHAVTFVRVKATGRLCPLCESCAKSYEAAYKSLSTAAKETIPGGGMGERVSLEDGATEFAKQPSREDYDKKHPKAKAEE
jgi:hypothetical protein